ncbi:MAG: TauD/TfdA family dioxygenase [Parvibaculum sp.]|nr:TauD/TfdA family dioxygenase [Parvibaculum sp.]
MTTDNLIRTRPLMAGFGVEILDVDLSTADEDARQNVIRLFHENGAIVLRGQTMAPDDLMAFIKLFGEPEDHTQTKFTLPGYPKIFLLSNKEVDGKPIGAHNDGVGWHTDYSYKEEPVMCTMLYAIEVPPEGSDTLLADLCVAYNVLPDARKAELDGLMLHHSYQHLMSSREFGRMELSDEMKAANPDVIHPLIRTHPANGRKALWVSTGTVKGVIGMEDAQAQALLDELVEFVTEERFVYRHKWQAGDILVWDNRCTLHTGTLFDDTKYVRLMHRLWAKGDKPF